MQNKPFINLPLNPFIYYNGKPINPLTIKSQPKQPISKANKPAFDNLADSLVKRLNAIPESVAQTTADSVVVDTVAFVE